MGDVRNIESGFRPKFLAIAFLILSLAFLDKKCIVAIEYKTVAKQTYMYTAISSFVHSSRPPGVSKTLIKFAPYDKAPECKSRILAPPEERPFSNPLVKIFTSVLIWSS